MTNKTFILPLLLFVLASCRKNEVNEDSSITGTYFGTSHLVKAYSNYNSSGSVVKYNLDSSYVDSIIVSALPGDSILIPFGYDRYRGPIKPDHSYSVDFGPTHERLTFKIDPVADSLTASFWVYSGVSSDQFGQTNIDFKGVKR